MRRHQAYALAPVPIYPELQRSSSKYGPTAHISYCGALLSVRETRNSGSLDVTANASCWDSCYNLSLVDLRLMEGRGDGKLKMSVDEPDDSGAVGSPR